MSFAYPPEGELDPRPIIARLIEECPEFEKIRLAKANITVFMRLERKRSGGKQEIGFLAVPQWMGKLGKLAEWMLGQVVDDEYPDFIMVLDSEWWEAATPRQREALVFHELCHAWQAEDRDGEPRFTAEGLPMWAIKEHDITAFNAEVSRYGAWHEDMRAFLTAARQNAV